MNGAGGKEEERAPWCSTCALATFSARPRCHPTARYCEIEARRGTISIIFSRDHRCVQQNRQELSLSTTYKKIGTCAVWASLALVSTTPPRAEIISSRMPMYGELQSAFGGQCTVIVDPFENPPARIEMEQEKCMVPPTTFVGGSSLEYSSEHARHPFSLPMENDSPR